MVATFDSGDFFGEAALSNADCLRTASVVVASPLMSCMALRRQELERLQIDRAAFIEVLLQLASKRKAESGSRAANAAFNPAANGQAARAGGRLSASGVEDLQLSLHVGMEHARAAATMDHPNRRADRRR